MMKKIYILAVYTFCILSIAQAQSQHELSVWGGGGLSTLKYNPSIGNQKNGNSGQLGIGYTYFFTENIGLGSGLEMSLYNAKTTFDSFSDYYPAKDVDGSDFEFRYRVNNYEEKQDVAYLNIPLMLHYQLPVTKLNMLYASAGFKLAIPITSKYEVKGASYKNSGYYAKENIEYTDMPFLGFGEYDNKRFKEDFELKIAYMLSAELGLKWRLPQSLNLYTGAYIDYGLNNVNKERGKYHLVEYDGAKPKDFKNNSIINSFDKDANGQPHRITDKVNLMSIGFKAKLSFGLGSK